MLLQIGCNKIKNPEISIQTVQNLVKKGFDVKLVIVTVQAERPKMLEEKYADLIPEHLEFVVDADMMTLRKLYSQAKLLLVPSSYEAFSYAVLEAFASGVPAVTSEAVPQELVQDGYNGMRIQDHSSEAYSRIVLRLLKDSGLWKHLSENAVKSAKGFSHLLIAKEYEKLFKCLLKG